MLAFRSVVSVLVSFVGRSFSTNSRPACGRPPAALRPGNDSIVTTVPSYFPLSLHRQHHASSRWCPSLFDAVTHRK